MTDAIQKSPKAISCPLRARFDAPNSDLLLQLEPSLDSRGLREILKCRCDDDSTNIVSDFSIGVNSHVLLPQALCGCFCSSRRSLSCCRRKGRVRRGRGSGTITPDRRHPEAKYFPSDRMRCSLKTTPPRGFCLRTLGYSATYSKAVQASKSTSHSIGLSLKGFKQRHCRHEKPTQFLFMASSRQRS